VLYVLSQERHLSSSERERIYYICPEERENTPGATGEIEEAMGVDDGDHFSGDGSAKPS